MAAASGVSVERSTPGLLICLALSNNLCAHPCECRRPSPAELVFCGAKAPVAARSPHWRRHFCFANAHRDGIRVPGDSSVLRSRESLGTRFRVPCELLDGSSRPMETGDYLSAMGCAGAVRIRRGSIHFLSSGLMDT